jgi:oligopeptide transport system substrate-binding protein
MAQARGLALLLASVALLAACGGSSTPKPPRGGAELKLVLPLLPRTLDPARAADLPTLNVVHELYAGLTRFSGTGVEPDLARSWDTSENGLVWTFHLRKGIRWSNDSPITAEDFRRSWLRALSPRTGSAFARAEMQNIRGARAYRVTGTGAVAVEAVDDHTLRITLGHPVPWLDQQVAWPVFFPVPRSGDVTSGPFRLASRTAGRLVLERSFNYWDVSAVKPRRLVLTTSAPRADGVLPRGLASPGFPWIDTVGPPAPGAHGLSTLATGLLWLVTKGTPLADLGTRHYVAWVLAHLDLGSPPTSLIPDGIPGAGTINSHAPVSVPPRPATLRLTLAYTPQDRSGSKVVAALRRSEALLRSFGIELDFRPAATLAGLVHLAGPPAEPGIDLVVLGWSSEFFDAYNTLDLFPCGSAFNVARWCNPAYDALMARAVRTLDERKRREIERRLVELLHDGVPAIPLYSASDHFSLGSGVGGFSWSPIGIYELMGMTRS